MALARREDKDHTIADELSRADEEAERRRASRPLPPTVSVVFIIDNKVLPAVEMPPFRLDDVYSSQVKTYRSGHLEDDRLNYTIHVSGATLNYHIESDK